jgi:hypothetical protein
MLSVAFNCLLNAVMASVICRMSLCWLSSCWCRGAIMIGADTIKTFFIFVFLTVIHFHPRLIFVDKTRSPPLEWTPARGLGHSLHRSKILVECGCSWRLQSWQLIYDCRKFYSSRPGTYLFLLMIRLHLLFHVWSWSVL